MDTKLLESLLAEVPPSGLVRADYTDVDDQCWYIVPGSYEGTIAKVAAGYGKLAELFSLAPDLLRDYIDLLRKVEAAEKLADEVRRIAEITERKENKYPADWREQIAACPECKRYKGHPIQNGICDEHRRPIYAQQDHDRHETYILGYRAQSIAAEALAAWDAAR